MASIVGEATITLKFDGKEMTAQLQETENKLRKQGVTSGKGFGGAWSVAAGNLISKGIGTVVDGIVSNLDRGIKRADTIANSQHVFEAMGYSADSVNASMDTLNGYLDGLPTSMTDAVQGVQALSASFGGIEVGTEAFMSMNNAGLAFGATTDQVSGAIMQLSQLPLDGPLDAQTWNSLRNNGFTPVFDAMAKESGMSVGELKEAFGSGELKVEDFLNMLNKLNKEGTGDMASLEELARANTDGIGTAMENVQNRIGKAIEKVIGAIGRSNISGLINDISSSFNGVADVVVKIIEFLANNQWILQFVGGFVATLGAAALAIKGIAIAQAIWNAALSASPITWIIIGVAALIGLIVVLVSNWETVSQVITDGLNAIGQVFTDLGDGIKQGLDQIGQFFTSVFQGIWDTVTGIFSKIGGFFQGVWGQIVSIFTTIGTTIGNAVSGAFKAVVNAVIGFAENFLNTPIRAINTLIDVINAVPGIDLGKLSELHFPRLAQGGVTTGSTIANIGEAGKEAVIPLERNTENWTRPLAEALSEEFRGRELGDRELVVNFYDTTVRDDDDIRKITQGISQAIRRTA